MTPNAAAEPRSVRYLRDLLLGLLPLLVGVQFLGWITFFPGALRGHADFRQLYAAGYMIRTGHAHQLFDYHAQKDVQDALVGADEMALPFIRPAYQALLFVPFSLLPYRTSYLTFLGVNLFLLAIAFWQLRPRLNNLATAWLGLPVFTFLIFYPLELSLLQGQDSILLLLLLIAALAALDGGRGMMGGVLLGLGLFKLQIVIPIALLFLLWRRWRLCAGFALAAGLLASVSVWTAGLTQTLVFIRALLSVGGVAGHQVSFPLRISIMANLRGLIYGLTHAWLDASEIKALTVMGSAVILGAAAFAGRRQSPKGQLSLAITISVMVSYYLFIHDLTVLLVPIALTLDRGFAEGQDRDPLSVASGWTAAFLLVAPMCIFVIPDYFYLFSLLIFTFMVLQIWGWYRERNIVEPESR